MKNTFNNSSLQGDIENGTLSHANYGYSIQKDDEFEVVTLGIYFGDIIEYSYMEESEILYDIERWKEFDPKIILERID